MAALDTNWDELHHRSRSINKQFTQRRDPVRQIAAARQLRTELLQADDVPGLRALRLATAAPMAGWLQSRSAQPEAQMLADLFLTDQRDAIPGLALLESELAQARRRTGQPSVGAGI